MAHNFRYRTPGTWSGILLPNEFNGIATNIAAGVNGDDGGVWAPPVAITLDGAGLQVTGPARFFNLVTLTVSSGGAYTIAGQLSIDGAVNVPSTGRIFVGSGATSTWQPDSHVVVKSGGLLVFGSTSTLTFGLPLLGQPVTVWQGSPTFTGFNGAFTGPVTFGAGATLATANNVVQNAGANAIISSPVTLAGPVTQACARVMTGERGVILWRRGLTPNASVRLDVSEDSYVIPAISSGIAYEIAHSGVGGTVVAPTGAMLHLTQRNGGATPTLKREDGSTIYAPSGAPWWADLYFDGGAWQFLDGISGTAGWSSLS